ncbi:MAG: pentapeptide repeat-containing protein [Goleter apudmare HA4340-LM2]|jgi:hypothetical protein|nr:pentapeptide repeat-containing protein [Goleter apudmare HA4340-LM2]
MSEHNTDALKNWFIVLPFIFILCLFIVLFAFVNLESLSIEQRLNYRTQSLTSIGSIFVAIALFMNAFYIAKHLETINRTAKLALINAQSLAVQQITACFSQSIKQLGNDKITVRLGAIYTLERIAKEYPKDHWTIIEILTAFVRENTTLKLEEIGKKKKVIKIGTDIQAALTVIGQHNSKYQLETHQRSLNHIDIRDADLHQANLQGTSLISANLQGVVFIGANLQSAFLISANLQGAVLTDANLQGAVLMGANLEMANLQGADMTGARYLTSEQIELAIGDRNTILPENLARPKHWQ